MNQRFALVVCLLVAACRTPESPAPAKAAAAPVRPTTSEAMPPGLDAAAMDLNADPCSDFYQYACGGWLAKNEIPPERASWGRLTAISDRSEETLRQILENASAGKVPEGTPYGQALGDFYAACMDEPRLNASLADLRSRLREIAKLRSKKTVAVEVARLHLLGATPLFDLSSTQDFKNATQVIGGLSQGGLGLPDRDYYLKDDAKTKEVREAYRAHVANVFALLGERRPVAERKAVSVLAFETELAKVSLDVVSRRDPQKVYHPQNRAGLKALAPGFDWDAYLIALGAPTVDAFTLEHEPFFAGLSAQLATVPLEDWKNYLAFRLASTHVLAQPKAFQDEEFAFSSKALTGAQQDLPRWRKCERATDAALGEALGVAYVAETFGADGKAQSKEMIQGIEAAFEANLTTVDWMDDATKARAREKARAIFNKVGYPDHWKTYDGLQITRRDFFGDLSHSHAYETARDLKRIGKPVEKELWGMTPPTLNAYYNPQLNEIVFPAGILQPPIFDKAASPPLNFGAIGAVMGHELTHGFDDEGRQFDAQGNLADWWTPESAKAFIARADCVRKQFDGYVAVDDVHVNGALTLGENVADLGGAKFAFAAMQDYLRTHSGAVPSSRFTPEQQFFIAGSQNWCAKVRPQVLRVRTATDPHSPPRWRAIGAITNMPQFGHAFACKADAPMLRKDRGEVW